MASNYPTQFSERVPGKRAKCGIFNGRLDCRPKKGLHKKSKETYQLEKDGDTRKTGGYFKPRIASAYQGGF